MYNFKSLQSHSNSNVSNTIYLHKIEIFNDLLTKVSKITNHIE